jgi:GT2 family glycosyltransferase/glycosyltransferase involved in cell wall biosynthesis
LTALPSCAAVVFGKHVSERQLPALLQSLRGATEIAYHGPDAGAGAARALGCRIGTPLDDMQQAVRHLRAEPVHRDRLLIALDVDWPQHGWARLAAAAAGSDADVLSPLGPEDTYTPLPEGAGSCAAADLDTLCALLADPERLPAARPAAHLALWRASAWRRLALGAIEADDAGLRVEAIASMFAGRHGVECRGPGVPIDRRDAPLASPLAPLRARIGVTPRTLPRALPGTDGRPVLLHVLHGWGGGVERFVRDLAEGDDGCIHLALCASGQFARRRYGEALELSVVAGGSLHSLRRWPLPAAIADTALQDAPYRDLLAWIIARYRVDRMMVSSLIGHSLDALATGLPTLYVCHDYYPLWPVLHADFGAADAAFDHGGLERALRSADSAAMPFDMHSPDYWWRLRSAFIAAIAEHAITLCAPSDSLRRNWLRIAPELAGARFEHIAHGFRPFDEPIARTPREDASRRLRLLVLGRINGGKALHLLEPALDRIAEHAELILVGCGASGQALFGRRHVHLLLDYRREQLPRLIATLAPDAALMPASVAESFSYTLSELWALGVPPLATRIGSFAERIVDGDTGMLFAPEPDAMVALVQQLAADRTPLATIRARLANVALRSVADARADYAALFAPNAIAVAAADPAAARAMESAALAEAGLLLEADVRALREERARQEVELHARAEWAQRTDRKFAALQVEFEERTRWAQMLVKEGERLGDELATARDSYRALDAEYQRFHDEKRRADAGWAAEVARVEQLRHELMNSTSWRITRPLRAVSTRLRGLRARLRYWFGRLAGLPPRLLRSLRTRGLQGTLARIGQDAAAVPVAPAPVELSVALAAPGTPFDAFDVPRAAAPVASIVIPVYNKFPYTLACLQSLAQHGARIGFEVIVVDDGSSDDTRASLARIGGIVAIFNERNLGFIGACNAGAAAARGDYLVFLNNDTQVTAGWLDALIDTFAQHRDVGLVGAKLVYPDGRLQEAGGIVFSDASGWNYGRFGDPRDPAYNYVREADYCSGAAIAIPRALFEQRGGFDTRYAPAYYEDTDLAFQVREAGLRVLYQPASTVIHFEGITSGTDTASGTKRYQVINQQKFAERWQAALPAQPRAGSPIAVAREHRVAGRMLIVDATIPEPDKDSGSVRMINLLRALIELGWKVSFATENRAYVAGYTERLQQLGVEVLYHPWMPEPANFLRDTGTLWDVVMLSRHYVATPLLPLVRHYAPRARVVFDTVDLHYLREERAAEIGGRADLRRAAATTRLAEQRLIRASDVTLVVSPVEQALIAKDLPEARVEVLSNVHEVAGCRRSFDERSDLFFVGGFQHQPNVDAMLWFVAEIWPRIAAALPDARFHIVGSRMPDAIRALASERVIATGFVESLDPYLDGCRLSVAPLRYGAGVKGKVNQSMAHGQPVVATALAAEGMFLEHDVDVLIADTPAEFADAVVRLYLDPELWQRLSDAGLANVARHFSFDAAKAALSRILGR